MASNKAAARVKRRGTDPSLLEAGGLQRAILSSANFSSIATDARGIIQIFNVGAERMLGYAATDVLNKITPADISDAQEVVARARALSAELGTPITPGFDALVYKASRGIEDMYELTYVRKDGSRFPAIVSVTALRDASDDIIGYLLIGTDNTARKQADAAQALLDQQLRDQRKRFELTLQQKDMELEHASRMKSEFLATMAHELRTPLNAIIGFSEALKDGLIGDMSQSQQDYIGDIFTSGQHLLSLINDILDLSKVEAGMMALELEPVDLGRLLSNALSIVREKAAAQHVHLELHADDDLGAPVLDTRKTKQIVYNLLSNAVKFGGGGSVTLKARQVTRDSVGKMPGNWLMHGFPLADNEFDDFLELSVTDSGIGISRANMAKLFQPFSQIDSSLARKFDGTGLGLAMVRQLSEILGGTVAVASLEGNGACFAAWLPLRTADQATHTGLERVRSAAAAVAVVESKERIALVIEDDDRAAELVRLLLEAEGFTVLRAASAEAALLMAPQYDLSLITLDVQLPGINGWEFLLHIRESSHLGRVPVVIIAGQVDSNMALTGGASALLEKPISRAQLKAALGNLGLAAEPAHTRTVLVVDDDARAVELIAAFLPPPAYAVVRAYGGSEAITLAQRLRPDLILLDLMMPDVNGFEVVKALQRNSETARIPILVVTAAAVTALDREALNSNSDHVIQIVDKAGFNRGAFLAEVRRALLPQPQGA